MAAGPPRSPPPRWRRPEPGAAGGIADDVLAEDRLSIDEMVVALSGNAFVDVEVVAATAAPLTPPRRTLSSRPRARAGGPAGRRRRP